MRFFTLIGIALAAFALSGAGNMAQSQEFTAISGDAAAPRSAFAGFGTQRGGLRGGGFRGHRFRGHGFVGREFKRRGFARGRYFDRHRFSRWGSVPLYLEKSYTPYAFNFQQIIVPAGSTSLFYAPSAAQLPQSAGTREDRAAQPIIYVINDKSASRRGEIVVAPKSSVAKIIELPAGKEDVDEVREEVAVGAKIIRLDVPAVRR